MSDSSIVFPHRRLDAYNVALALAGAFRALVERMLPAQMSITDQMSRADLDGPSNLCDVPHAGEYRGAYPLHYAATTKIMVCGREEERNIGGSVSRSVTTHPETS